MPVSFPLLWSLISALQQVSSSCYEASLFATAFGLAFFGAFRVGELIAPSHLSPGGLLLDEQI